MFLIRFWHFLKGYLIIKVEGLSLERYINITASNGVKIWNIERAGYTQLTCCISISDFRRLHSLTKKVKWRIKIIDKVGLPFIIHRYHNRKMFFAGIAVFLMIIYTFSSFIWSVEVSVKGKIDEQVIIEKLRQYGIEKGVFKGGINQDLVENRMLVDLPQLTWINIKIKGTKAFIDVVESAEEVKIIDKNTPCNIVAAKDGIIDDMTILEGYAEVKPGDTVKRGQVLVSGIIYHEDSSVTRYVHSMGEVIAKTWYEANASVSIKEAGKNKTGNVYKTRGICWRNRFLEKTDNKAGVPFEDYAVDEKNYYFFGKNRFLPIGIKVLEFQEIVKLPYEKSLEMAKRQAAKKAQSKVIQKINSEAKVIDKKIKYDMIKGEVKAVIYVETLENIAVTKELMID